MLIFIRRIFALLLIPVFIVLFLGTLLTFRVNATLLEADFYTDTLEELDAYEFLYDEAIPVALERAETEGDFDLDEDVPLNLGLTPQNVSARIKEVLPPEWLAENIAAVINAGVPYITGGSDEFEITIPVDDRVEAATAVAQQLILDADIHTFMLDEIEEQDFENEEFISDLPFGLSLTNAQIVDGVRTIVPESWLRDRIAGVIDEVLPYLVGKVETFSVHIPLQARTEAGLEVAEDWLLTSLEGGAYDYLLDEQITPVVRASLGAGVELPFGVSVSDQEIVDALGAVLPQEWVAERVGDAVDAVGPYLTGATESFTLIVPLEDRALLAAETLEGLVNRRFEAVFNSLGLPGTYEQFIGQEGIDVLDELVAGIVDPLPDEIRITNDQLFGAIAADSPIQIEDIRELLRDGLTFTEQDLIELIEEQASSPGEAQDNVDLLNDARGYLRDGFTFDQTQVEEQFERQADFDAFDDARGYVALGRDFLFLLIVLLAAIALFIGMLGGRRWGTRLIWAGVPVLLAGAAMAIAFGPVAAVGFETGDDYIQDLDIDDVFVDKLIELQQALEESFVAPIAFQSAVAGAGGAAMILFGAFIGRRRSHRAPQVAAGGGTWETTEAAAARQMVSELRAEVGELQDEVEELQTEVADAQEKRDGDDKAENGKPPPGG